MCKSSLGRNLSKSRGKPAWLRKQMPKGKDFQRVTRLLSEAGLHTVCQEANCPNMFECFSKDTSTFMILGSQCTRHCRFCNVSSGTPLPVDMDEPMAVARAAKKLGLQYVVVTSVTRDDLPDGGASQFAAVIRAIGTTLSDQVKTEVLIPDFQGNTNSLKIVAEAKPAVINHNIETVSALYSRVRPEASYQQSLDLLRNVKKMKPEMDVKSGIMVGLGETMIQLEQTLSDLLAHGCDIVTIGQYLQPSRDHLPVEKFYSPEEFLALENRARKMGFERVAAGPFVRSSYKAQELYGKKSFYPGV